MNADKNQNELREGWIDSARDVATVKRLADKMCAAMHADAVQTQRMIEAAWPTLPEIAY